MQIVQDMPEVVVDEKELYTLAENVQGFKIVVVNENHPIWVEGQAQMHHDRIVNVANTPCAYFCGWAEPYGFVPEADCPMHDAPSFKPSKEEWDEIIRLHREHKPQPCGCGEQRGRARASG